MKAQYQRSNVCRVCGSENLTKAYQNVKDPHFSVEDKFDILACEDCSFLFTDPMVMNKDLGFLYEGHYFGIDNKLSFFEKKYRFDQYRFDFGLYKNKFTKDMTMLDYGCGNGTRVEYLQEQGYEAFGIDEFDLLTTDIDKNNFIIKNPLQYFPEQKYDVVFLYHVLEHLRELPEHLAHIKNNCLKEGGFLVIQVPNADCWQFKKYTENYTMYDVPRHFWHFNQKGLKFLLEKNGFNVKEQSCVNSILHPSTILSGVFKYDIRKEWQKPKPNKWLIHAKFGLFCLLSIPIMFYENMRDNSTILNCIAQNKK
jgi:SAM-dependent methyltransferase